MNGNLRLYKISIISMIHTILPDHDKFSSFRIFVGQ